MILRLAALWATAAGTLWVHALLGIPGDDLDQGFPLYPGLKVTLDDLALTAVLATLPIPLAAALARHLRLRWLALPPLALLWLLAADAMIQPFATDFGTTWAGTEPLRALFFHPLQSLLALTLTAAVAARALAPRRATQDRISCAEISPPEVSPSAFASFTQKRETKDLRRKPLRLKAAGTRAAPQVRARAR